MCKSIKKFVSICMAVVIFLSSVQIIVIAAEPSTLTFEQSVVRDYPVTTSTVNAQYFFETDDIAENTALVLYSEAILSFAEKHGLLNCSSAKIYFTSDNEKTMVTASSVTVHVSDIYSTGAIMHYISRTSQNSLPAWLCAGLEIYALESQGLENRIIDLEQDFNVAKWAADIDSKGLPVFSDALFLPGFTHDGKFTQVAYAFVKYLVDRGSVAALVELYMSYPYDKSQQANVLFLELWQDFSGFSIDSNGNKNYIFRYFYNYNNRQAVSSEMARVYATHGTYSFFVGKWDYEELITYVDTLEDMTAFVKGWLGAASDEPIRADLTLNHTGLENDVNSPKAYARSSYYYIAEPAAHLAYAGVHEITHAVALREGISTNFATVGVTSGSISYFNEALADVINISYGIEKELNAVRDQYEKDVLISLEWVFDSDLNDDPSLHWYTSEMKNYAKSLTNDDIQYILDIYKKMSGYSYPEDPIDPVFWQHILAILTISAFKDTLKVNGNMSINYSATNKYFYLYTRQTATSFFLYLLDIGTKENLLKVLRDPSLIKKVYDKSFDELVDNWLKYLNLEW